MLLGVSRGGKNIMTWKCAAINHAITFYSDGTITPCVFINHTYRKPIESAYNNPFSDLDTGIPQTVCQTCHNAESHDILSNRERFNQRLTDTPGIQSIDIRNFNLCNARCRTCGPYNSNQWGNELGKPHTLAHQVLTEYKSLFITPALREVHYTGGEPFINGEQWVLLEELIDAGLSKNISLNYNSNLSVLKYKDKNIVDLWKNFRSVSVVASIDAIGTKFNYLRSGLNWNEVEKNIEYLRSIPNISLSIGTTVSILNLWFIVELLDYFQGKLKVNLTDLHFPDYLALTTIPDRLKDRALEELSAIEQRFNDRNKIEFYRQQVLNNETQHLFRETLNHILLLDNIRQEKLFDLLPFREIAQEIVFYE